MAATWTGRSTSSPTACRIAAIALSAYLPDTSARILAALKQPPDVGWENVAYGRTAATSGIEAAPPLFPRIDEPATAA